MGSAAVLPEIDEEVFEGEDIREGTEKLYHVILLNDEDHTYDYVIEMLMEIFEMDEDKAYQHTVEVDTKGHSRLATLPLSKAEIKRDQIHNYGADPRLARSRGGMAALLEPAE
jgi:ATP-dependent Clp protease adaptor protein ClpS